YALLTGNIPSVSHFKPFGCHVTILNTSDHLGKFDGKADEGYIVGYSASNRAYRVYNVPNKRVEETMNLRYLEEKPNVQGLGHEWYFDLDYLTDTLGYKRDKANQSAGTQEASTNPAGTQDADSDSECDEQVIIVPSYPSHSIQAAEPKDTSSDEVDDSPLDSAEEIFKQELARLKVPPGSIPVPTSGIPVPSGDTTVSPGNVLVSTSGVPVPTGSPMEKDPLKEYVEKIKLLKIPEERARRLEEYPLVRDDPTMDPDCFEDETEVDDKNQESYSRSDSLNKFNNKGRDHFSPRGDYTSKEFWDP
ncbi:hypothetical protein Tco_0009234, partial [Tanacetum coccineum]